MTTTLAPAVPSMELLGQAAVDDAGKRSRGCAHPVRLVGSTTTINQAHG